MGTLDGKAGVPPGANTQSGMFQGRVPLESVSRQKSIYDEMQRAEEHSAMVDCVMFEIAVMTMLLLLLLLLLLLPLIVFAFTSASLNSL